MLLAIFLRALRNLSMASLFFLRLALIIYYIWPLTDYGTPRQWQEILEAPARIVRAPV